MSKFRLHNKSFWSCKTANLLDSGIKGFQENEAYKISLQETLSNFIVDERAAKRQLASVKNNGNIISPKVYGLKSPIRIETDDFWRSNVPQGKSPGFYWWLFSMKYLQPFVKHGSLQFPTQVVLSWWKINKPMALFRTITNRSAGSVNSWSNHPVAIRAELISALYLKLGQPKEFNKILVAHGKELAKSRNYDGNWNHGIDQNIALISCGLAIGNKKWIRLAANRGMANANACVDELGVSNEQATGYQYYVFVRLNRLLDLIRFAGEKKIESSLESKLQLMLDFITHTVMPSGSVVNLGDTHLSKAAVILNGLHELHPTQEVLYSASSGKEGTPPKQKKVIYHSGFVFGRSGWGLDRPFRDETFYSIRFGKGRKIHGHNDHTSITFQFEGVDVLVDGGFHGYSQDEVRDYLRTPLAHNVVSSTAAKSKFQWNEETALTYHSSNEFCDVFSFEDRPYNKVSRKRHLLVSSSLGVLVVLDIVDGVGTAEFQQRWHVGPRFKATKIESELVKFESSSGQSVVFQQLWGTDTVDPTTDPNSILSGTIGLDKGELTKVPLLRFIKSGKRVTLLTLIDCSSAKIEPSRLTRLSQKGLAEQEFSISKGFSEFEFTVTADGLRLK